MLGFIFGKKETKIELSENKKETSNFKIVPQLKCNCSKEKLYVVTSKATDTILGIYNNLEKAKFDGEKSTYHNCRITSFRLNSCSHLNPIVFENK
jgi:hypothetical protein